ncbi:MAG: DUF998 domain-containing protein [Woeseiaceae bacterium]|nr:DUF998 domain-containing protein [Woeseiaceae bacterium]
MIEAAVVLSLIAPVYLGIAVVVAASRRPAYSHFRNTISELAEFGSEYTASVSFGVFLPVAIMLGIVALLVGPTNPPIAALALSIAIGYGVGAIFPSDPGSPMIGSSRQAVHNLGGAIEYLGGALSLFWIAETSGPAFRVLGFVVAASAILVSFESPVRGAIQRIAESCLFLGLLTALWLR